jgi:peptidoglycan/LPS O-acetylase OafA/YrhL
LHEMVVIVGEHQTAVSASANPNPGRLVALDGLRGIAALVVVFHHIYQIARPFLEPTTHAWAVGSLWWFISATPIKLLSAGSESVLVFFVLSGVVVPLPLLAKGARAWVGFFLSRLARLYLPVWASLLLAAAWITFVPHPADAVTAGSWVQRTNGTAASPGLLFSEAGLMRNSFSSNSVLWSLRWEVIFCLVLPLFLLAAVAIRRFWMPAVFLSCGLTLAGKLLHIDALLYLPVFFLGTLVAVNLEAIQSWSRRTRVFAGLRGSLLVAACLAAIVASWMLRPVIPAGTVASDAVGSLTPVGALGLVVCAIAAAPVRRALSAPIPQRLGRISFSLYLTHLPILVAFTYLLGDRNWILVAVVGIPISLGVAVLFFRFVEAPSHRLAGRIRSLLDDRSRRIYVGLRARHVARLATA